VHREGYSKRGGVRVGIEFRGEIRGEEGPISDIFC